MTEDDPAASVEAIHDHLEATEELPVDTAASRWIGEAQAVAADLVGAEVDRTVLRQRLGHVRDLLDQVEETGHPEADGHIARARALTEQASDRLDDDGDR